MSMIDLLTAGKVEGFDEMPQVITTTLSRVFLFHHAKKVLKVYRRDNEYWNKNFIDLSAGVARSQFIREDFLLNQKVNPRIYLDIQALMILDGRVVFQPTADASDELVIIMNHIGVNTSFTDLLAHSQVSSSDCETIGMQFAMIKRSIEHFMQASSYTWYELLCERLAELRLWMESLHPLFTQKDIETCLSKLNAYTQLHKERFELVSGKKLIYTIDAHGENAMFQHGILEFIDVYLPKEIWRWSPPEYDIFRLGADVYALAGETGFHHYLNGVREVYPDVDATDQEYYLLYSSVLMLCILSTLTESKPEKKTILDVYYRWFLERLNAF